MHFWRYPQIPLWKDNFKLMWAMLHQFNLDSWWRFTGSSGIKSTLRKLPPLASTTFFWRRATNNMFVRTWWRRYWTRFKTNLYRSSTSDLSRIFAITIIQQRRQISLLKSCITCNSQISLRFTQDFKVCSPLHQDMNLNSTRIESHCNRSSKIASPCWAYLLMIW